MITYQQYSQDSSNLHNTFYRQFVTPVITSTVLKFIGKDKVLASEDPHLNDIPLQLWDILTGYNNCSGGLFSVNPKRWEEAGGSPLYYSNKLCVAKQAALMWKEKQQQQ